MDTNYSEITKKFIKPADKNLKLQGMVNVELEVIVPILFQETHAWFQPDCSRIETFGLKTSIEAEDN